jgi:two-component system chemotaxis response regulator CheB
MLATKVIKVMLVEDSPVALGLYKRLLESSPEIEIVGTAGNGKEAVNIISQVQPDVMITDLHMPQMDGFELIKNVMATYPIPILVLSNVVQPGDIDNRFEAMKAGAVEIMAKPQGGGDNAEELQAQLVRKVKILSTKKVNMKPL